MTLADLAKKVVFASLGSAVAAGEMITDSKLPREVLENLKNRAGKTKDDIMNVLAREVSTFLGKINVSEELAKALNGLIVNLNASIDFKKKREE